MSRRKVVIISKCADCPCAVTCETMVMCGGIPDGCPLPDQTGDAENNTHHRGAESAEGREGEKKCGNDKAHELLRYGGEQ